MALAFRYTPSLHAQFAAGSPAAATATAPETFDYILGTRDMNGASYTVKATQPPDSKLKSQRVRFTSVANTANGTTTHYFTINTGKYKTVGQLDAYLHDTFAKFLAGAPVNAELGKVGDAKYGGEIRFVVVSPDALRYDTVTPGEPDGSMTLPRAEVAAYAAILGGEAPARR